MFDVNQIDRKVLESVHHLLRDLIIQVEEKLFYPKEFVKNNFDLDLNSDKDPF